MSKSADRYVSIEAEEAYVEGYFAEGDFPPLGYTQVLVDTVRKTVIYEDGEHEPEDQTLYRNQKPLVDELNRLAEELHDVRD